MVIKARRIKASDQPAYTSWSFPSVDRGRVIKAQTSKAFKRAPAGAMPAAATKTVMRESLQSEVERNIKAGKYVNGITARELESIILESAREGREAGYAEGFRKGHEQGLTDGKAEGLASGQGIIEDAATRLQQLLTGLNQPLLDQEAGIRDALVHAVTRLTTEVLKREMSTRADVIEDLVRESVAAMPVGAPALSIRLSPHDIALLEQSGSVFDPNWNIQSDAALANGQCCVERGDSLVRFSQSERMQSILDQYFSAAAAQSDDG